MIMYVINSFVIFLVVVTGLSATTDLPPRTVNNVDLNRYAGEWYEIAKIPNRFQIDCASNTTAKYELKQDGRIRVINRCLNNAGKVMEVKGVAKVVDEQSNAKLKVSFISILGWQLFWGDYWIIGLGKDYDYALVGHPERKYGWILSRSARLDEEKMNDIFAQLKNNGYDPYKFEFTRQNAGI